MKTIVLTSKENFVWISMTEIVPSLEEAWLGLNQYDGHDVEIVDVDQKELKELMPILMTGEQFVFTVFTVKLAKIGQLLRSQLGIPGRYVIHLHNLATIACWPLHQWGWGSVLKQSDIFISTCQNDVDCMAHSFENPRVELVPFHLLNPVNPVTQKTKSQETHHRFVFVGRLSVQKNLHNLIFGFYRLKEKFPDLPVSLDIYGKEDGLGCPHLEYRFPDYQQFLIDLTHQLKLENEVTFKGYLERSQLEDELQDGDYTFVSPSLHSDENFGIAALRSLSRGARALLSDWGGHRDFKTYFGEQVHLVPVREGRNGPFLDIEEWVKGMQISLGNEMPALESVPDYYQKESIVKSLKDISDSLEDDGEKLKPTQLALEILQSRQQYKEAGGEGNRIFDSFSDPRWKPFFQSYGMKTPPSIEGDTLCLVPWGEVGEKGIEINDPHKGRSSIPLKKGDLTLKSVEGKYVKIDRETAHVLAETGHGNFCL